MAIPQRHPMPPFEPIDNSWSNRIPVAPKEPKPQTLDDILAPLHAFGAVQMSACGKVWHCQAESHSISIGTTVCVQSDYTHSTPESAATQCAQRLAAYQAISKVKAP